jgi:hypothetical protein
MTINPLDDTNAAQQQRIRERAYHLWEADGCPQDRSEEYWERARELVGIEESPHAGEVPVAGERPEESFIQENLGEFPDRSADQGEHQATPEARARKRA